MSKVIKSIVDAAEEARRRTVALPYPTKTPQPTVALPYPTKTPQITVTKAPRIGRNTLDPGDSAVGKYSKVETLVQNVEDVDAVVSNVGAAAAGGARALPLVAKVAPNVAKLTPTLNVARTLGTKLAPVQVGLWGVDVGRAALDPEYRQKTHEATHEIYDDPDKSTTRKSFDTALNTFARPISTTGAMTRSYVDSTNRIKVAEEGIRQSDRKLYQLEQRRLEPQRRRDVEDVREYIRRAADEGRRPRNNEELRRSPLLDRYLETTPRRETYEKPEVVDAKVFPTSLRNREISRSPLILR
jgi:hypothetical protein